MSSQMERVVSILEDGKERTLRDIEHEIWRRYRIADTQPAISARLRNYGRLFRLGWVRKTTIRTIKKTRVWFYRLTKAEARETS